MIPRWLRVPPEAAGNPVLAVRWRVFHVIALVMLLGLPFVAIILFQSHRLLIAGHNTAGLVPLLAILIVLAALRLARSGHLDAARAMLAVLHTSLLATGMLLGDGLHDMTVALLGASMLIGSLLLDRWSYIVLATAAVALCGAIGLAEMNSWMVTAYQPLLTWDRVAFVCITLALTAIPVRALMEVLERSLIAVTERNQRLAESNAELQAQRDAISSLEERFAKIFQTSPDPMLISRKSDGQIVEVNEAWVTVFGYQRSECLGVTGADLGLWVEPADRVLLLASLKAGKPLRSFETRLRKKSGEVAAVSMSAEVIDLDGVEHLIIPVIDVTERKQAESRIRFLATRDALTGLPNRMALMQHLGEAMAEAKGTGASLALLFLDLDRFKSINDSLGHLLGDAFLRAVAQRLSPLLGEGESLSRLGGDEFVAVISPLGSHEQAAQLAQRMLDALRRPLPVEEHELSRDASVGISIFPGDATEPSMLLRNADTAMYHAKAAGGGGYRFFTTDMNERAQRRLWMEEGLRSALELGQFEMHYQPKVEIGSGQVTGFEALLRWHHPSLGEIPPSQFIEVAEETGQIVPIGRWVFDDVCRQMAQWHSQGLRASIAINLSVRQFTTELYRDIRDTLAASGIDPKLVEVEITESLFMQDPIAVGGILGAISALGVRVALDDFGTGFSSLTALRRFAIDTLKIDRAFIVDIERNQQDLAIVRAVIGMARSIGARVIAEGVERQAQLGILRGLGCDEYQGFLYARPMPAAEVEAQFLKGS
ncbi:MAG: EAL domain-containing protein [Rhodanobacteraceae bacterium]|nr:EAL domain-containing protein [Rhodanobacteraceae bacterium]